MRRLQPVAKTEQFERVQTPGRAKRRLHLLDVASPTYVHRARSATHARSPTGHVWNRTDKLGLKEHSIVTISALIGKGIVDSSLKYHPTAARANGVTETETAAILAHIAFYAGWPNAWAAFNMAKEAYAAGEGAPAAEQHGGFFGLGKPNDGFAQHFIGQSYLNPMTGPDAYPPISNFTFEPGCRNDWRIHHASKGGGRC